MAGSIRTLRRLATMLAGAALFACGGGETTAPPPPSPPPTDVGALALVRVTPSTAAVAVGESTQLGASGQDAHGRTVRGVTFTWVALDPEIAAVAGTGTVTGVQAGQARVVASASGFADTAIVTVSAAPEPPAGPAPVARVQLTPDALALQPGGGYQLAALVFDTDGLPVTTEPIAWRSLEPATATVSAAGYVTAVAAGLARIVATVDEAADTVSVLVAPAVEPTPVPAGVSVTPSQLSLVAGSTGSLTAIVRDTAGQVLAGYGVVWSSDDAQVAAVSPNGLVTAVGAGQATITASAGGQRTTVTVTVTPIPVATVRVTPATSNMVTGGTLQLEASALSAAGAPLTGRSVGWSTSDASVARVAANGVVTAVAPGSATITATVEGKTATARIQVSTPAAAPASITISPAAVTLIAGGTQQLTATVRDASGQVIDGYTPAWSGGHPAVATISGSGLVTAVGPGSVTFVATAAGKTASVTVTVTPVTVASVTISPSPVSLEPGHAQQLTATPRDASGRPVSGRTATWSGGSPSVATVSASGLVTAVAVGSTTVTATVSGRSASVTVTVTAPAPTRTSRSLTAVTQGTMASDSTQAELPLPGVLVAGDDETSGLAPLQAVVVFSLGDIPDGATIESATLPVTMDPAGVFGDPYSLGALYAERASTVTMNTGAVSAGALQLAAAQTPSVTAELRSMLQAAVNAGEPYLIVRIRFERSGNGNGQTDQLELAVGELAVTWVK
ncbi:MAG TPA: Ig-like domain-containing protein [Gemmatimonadaceae bacterium]|nr:Ig-like domain-containing protein [Gemmatimonadaceae bacterium]